MEVHSFWESISIWFDFRDRVFDSRFPDFMQQLEQYTDAGSRKDVVENLFSLAQKYPNLFGIPAFGGLAFTFVYLMSLIWKRPLQKQAVENSRFKATTDGYERLIGRLNEEIEYKEKQEAISREYEADLVGQVRRLQIVVLELTQEINRLKSSGDE